jgi:hypothetical protein
MAMVLVLVLWSKLMMTGYAGEEPNALDTFSKSAGFTLECLCPSSTGTARGELRMLDVRKGILELQLATQQRLTGQTLGL